MQEEGGLDGLECKDVLLDLLEQCGSDIPISVRVKGILLYCVLHPVPMHQTFQQVGN